MPEPTPQPDQHPHRRPPQHPHQHRDEAGGASGPGGRARLWQAFVRPSTGQVVVGVLLAAGSLNLSQIVYAQEGPFWHWYFIPLLPLFVVYFIAGIAETNRAPFDVAEGESEIVAGFHVEYSGMTFLVFFLAEYANMILVSVLASLMFVGGWLSPFNGIAPEPVLTIPVLGALLGDGAHWLLLKTAFFLFLFLWFRATFPRYRYDQIMRLGWKVFIPITIVWLLVAGGMVLGHVGPWFA